MKYVVLVSHGTFAPGLKSVLEMLAGGERDDIIAVGLENGMGADEYVVNLEKAIAGIAADDEIILMGDLMGGSPLTHAADVVTKKGFAKNTICFGGVNLGMALTAVMDKDCSDLEELRETLMEDGQDCIKEFVMVSDDEEEADDDI